LAQVVYGWRSERRAVGSAQTETIDWLPVDPELRVGGGAEIAVMLGADRCGEIKPLETRNDEAVAEHWDENLTVQRPDLRSEERRVRNEWVSTCRSRGSP